MKTLTYEGALASLRKVVAAKGEDYVYEPPTFRDYSIDHGQEIDVTEYAYFCEDGSPSCIVGHVLHDIGITKAEIGDLNRNVIFNHVGPSLYEKGTLAVTSDALHLLRFAQREQDQNRTWGAVLAFATTGVGASR